MSQSDLACILLAPGYFAAGMSKDGKTKSFTEAIKLINRINKGNPEFIPYATETKEKSGR